MSKDTENIYVELDKKKFELSKKRERIEQGRRNFEALAKVLNFALSINEKDKPVLDIGEFKKAMSASVKAMTEVENL